MGTGKGAKAEENITTEESGKNPQVESGSVEEEFEDDLAVEDEDIDVTMRITAEWGHHYNAEVEITNLSEDKIDDWEISFDFENKIENIWNAQITDYDEELQLYTIKNVVWNQDIKPGEKVCFGMTVSYAEKKDTPSDWYLTKACMEVQDEYDVDLKEYNRFDGNKINGQITITNRSGHTIEDWKLDFSSNLYSDENQVWGAELLDGDYASFDNKDAIKNIEPGQSVSFTFIATCDDDNVDIFEYTLYEMIEIPEELEGDDEWEDEYKEDVLAQYYFERSDFVSDEAYEEYLIRHEAWKNTKTYISLNKMNKQQKNAVLQSIATTQPTASPQPTGIPDVPQKVNTTFVLKTEDKELTVINAGGNAVQTFCHKGNDWYLVQRISNKVVVTKTTLQTAGQDTTFNTQWKLTTGQKYIDLSSTNKDNKVMTLNGYQHGQSLEIFTYKSKQYLLMTAGTVGKNGRYGNQIAILPFKEKEFTYGNDKDEKKLQVKYLVGLKYANKKQKSAGVIRQAEAALSEDEGTLLVWAEMARKEAATRKVQVSCYNMKNIMKQLFVAQKKKKKTKKKEKAKTIICRRSFKNLDKKICYCSALQDDKDKTIVKPHDSIQAVDLANKANGKYKIFICGGNADDQKPLSIAVMTLQNSKSNTKATKYLARTDVMLQNSESVEGQTELTNIYGTDRLEMEGMHYYGGKLHFIIVPSSRSGVDKTRQIMYALQETLVQ